MESKLPSACHAAVPNYAQKDFFKELAKYVFLRHEYKRPGHLINERINL